MRSRRRAARAAIAIALAAPVGGCGDSPDARGPSNVVATVSAEITTVVIVKWKTAVPTTGYAEFGPTAKLGARTPIDGAAATDHTAILLGLTADTPVFYRAVSADNGRSLAAAAGTAGVTASTQVDVKDRLRRARG